MTTESRDIVERLEEWALRSDSVDMLERNSLTTDLREAITTIKFLRKAAGAVTQGSSFAEITKDLPRRSTEPPDPA
jgi:hypothetical protein